MRQAPGEAKVIPYAMLGAAGSRDEVRELFTRHGEPKIFSWVEEILGRIDHRAENHDTEAPPIQLVRGDLVVADLALDSPWIVVVDGNVSASADLDFATKVYDQSLLVVLGDLEARNLRFNSSACCYVKGNVTLRGACFGDHGDEAAELYCQRLQARAVFLDHVTGLNAAELDAVVCSARGWGLPMHVDYGGKNHPELFVAEVLHEGRLQLQMAWDHAHAGWDVFLPGVYEELRSRGPHIDKGGKPR